MDVSEKENCHRFFLGGKMMNVSFQETSRYDEIRLKGLKPTINIQQKIYTKTSYDI